MKTTTGGERGEEDEEYKEGSWERTDLMQGLH